jgi:guanylate kinase
MLSISCTTRSPRKTERDGQWYNFVTEERFQQMADQGEFLEYAQVFGKNWYGTPRKWLEDAQTKGQDLVLEIDVQGAAQVKRKLPGALSIFIMPPSWEELEKRVRARGQDSNDEIERRLQRAREELEQYTEYDYVVVNDDVERAGSAVQAIVLAARCQVWRHAERFAEVLKKLGG